MPSIEPVIGAVTVIIRPEVGNMVSVVPDLNSIDAAPFGMIQKPDLYNQRKLAAAKGDIAIAALSTLTIPPVKQPLMCINGLNPVCMAS